ncbi:MAG: hypothetical protein KKF44_04995 [Nanoarchaeota archaeon]|nr:hypothetical protein [Nanoarchaeota archaeon]
MKEVIKQDIIVLLEKSIAALQKGDVFKLRMISDEVIHNASIFQDEDSISTAIIIYSISKLYKDKAIATKNEAKYLDELKLALQKNDYDLFRKKIKVILKKITEGDASAELFIGQIVKQAQISKATKIYDHGISVERVAETLGISMWELMDYIGKTQDYRGVHEKNIKEKLMFTRSLFN